MYSTARTDVRPPAMALRPRIRPEVAIDRGDANQGSDLMAADSPEVGQFSEKSACGHVADARNGFQERLGFAPSWGMLDGVADVVVDGVELLLEIGDVAREPSGERLVDGLAAPVGFHADHLDDLAPPTDEFGEVDPLRFPKRPCLWTHALGEKGDHLRVERVGLGQAAHRAGEVSDLARVNDTERQPNAGEGRRNSGFEAASRL